MFEDLLEHARHTTTLVLNCLRHPSSADECLKARVAAITEDKLLSPDYCLALNGLLEITAIAFSEHVEIPRELRNFTVHRILSDARLCEALDRVKETHVGLTPLVEAIVQYRSDRLDALLAEWKANRIEAQKEIDCSTKFVETFKKEIDNRIALQEVMGITRPKST